MELNSDYQRDMDVTRTREGDIVIVDLIPEMKAVLKEQCVDGSRIWKLSKETWEKVKDLFIDTEIRTVEIGSREFIDNIRPMLNQS